MRTGGFAGLRREWVIETDEQPDADAWHALLDACPWNEPEAAGEPEQPGQPGQPDRFVYEVVAGDRRATLPERALGPGWRDLVERVRNRAAGP